MFMHQITENQKLEKLKEEIDKFTIIFGTSIPHYWQLHLTNSKPARTEN